MDQHSKLYGWIGRCLDENAILYQPRHYMLNFYTVFFFPGAIRNNTEYIYISRHHSPCWRLGTFSVPTVSICSFWSSICWNWFLCIYRFYNFLGCRFGLIFRWIWLWDCYGSIFTFTAFDFLILSLFIGSFLRTSCIWLFDIFQVPGQSWRNCILIYIT